MEAVANALIQKLNEAVLVAVHPEHLPPNILSLIDVVIAVGRSPDKTLQKFNLATRRAVAAWPTNLKYTANNAVVCFPRDSDPPFAMRIIAPRRDRIRHRRKYADGDMRYHSFYFRRPDNRHNLKTQNLAIFSRIAEGIDAETRLFHLHRRDYSRWFRYAIKDRYLADQAERIERRRNLQPGETRNLMHMLIESRYRLPE